MKRWILLLALLTLVGAPAVTAQPSGPNLVQNGSFEFVPVCPAGHVTKFQGDLTILDWTIEDGAVVDATPGSVDHICATWEAADLLHSIDLNGDTPGGLSQNIVTVPGEEYLLSFWMAGNWGGPPTIKTMNVEWGLGNVVYQPTFDVTGKTSTNMGWEQHFVSLEAESALTTLRFISTTGADGAFCPCFGPALDDVSVQEFDDDDGDGEDDDEDGEDEDGDGDDDDGDEDDAEDNDD